MTKIAWPAKPKILSGSLQKMFAHFCAIKYSLLDNATWNHLVFHAAVKSPLLHVHFFLLSLLSWQHAFCFPAGCCFSFIFTHAPQLLDCHDLLTLLTDLGSWNPSLTRNTKPLICPKWGSLKQAYHQEGNH